MKVLDLQCAQGHSFEGWFGSQEDYDSQRAGGLVTCPVCNDSDILKKLSAPRLNLGHGVAAQAAVTPVGSSEAASSAQHPDAQGPRHEALAAVHSAERKGSPETLQQLQVAMLQAVRHVMANTEDVGARFAEEARKIHYGERAQRNIRGAATLQETQDLIDEGIDVMPLPMPEILKGPLQ